MNYSWDWSVLVEAPYIGWLVSGTGLTVAIAGLGWVIAMAVGTAVGIARTLPARALRVTAALYVQVFRNIPLLVQMFLWYFAFPEVVPAAWGHWLKRDLPHPEFWTAVVALGLFTAARVAEQVRAGIGAVPPGQRLVALASGMGTIQVLRLVVLPQCFRTIVQPLTSEFLTVFKNSSLALTIGVLELTAQSHRIESETFQGFEAFTAATAIYLAIAALITGAMRFVEQRGRRRASVAALALAGSRS